MCIEVGLQLTTQPFAHLLEKESSGLQSSHVGLRGRKGLFASKKNQVINNFDLYISTSTYLIRPELLKGMMETLP
jgi:hypothetical protein